MNEKQSFDVIVAGSGPAGIGAAIAAARAGASVLLIEQSGTVGGVSTGGLMSHWTGNVDSKLYREVLGRACEEEGRAFDERAYVIHTEYLELTYIKMLLEAGVEILLYSFVCDVVLSGSTVTGVVAQSKDGKRTFTAKTVIDCTGDGDIAQKSGAAFEVGRESDGKMQPATLMFSVAGVDISRAVFIDSFERSVMTEHGDLQTLAKKLLPHPAGHVLLYRATVPGVVVCNMTNCTDVDGTRAEDLTRATLVCRSQIPAIIEFLRKYVKGYENCYFLRSAAAVGVRETRRILGEHILTEQEVYEGKTFDDWVVKGAEFNFDVHNITGAGLDATGLQKDYRQREGGYTIPFRSLIPKGIDGLLVAGRCISGTHIAHSNYRAMPICLAMGEGAGTAAALAAIEGVNVRNVPTADIQKRLV